MFFDETDESSVKAAIDAGVSAYVVDGLNSHRLKPIRDAAIARFQMIERMRREFDATKEALHERKMLDRANGLRNRRLR